MDSAYSLRNELVIFSNAKSNPTFKTKAKRLIVSFQSRQRIREYTVELQWLEHLWNHENMFWNHEHMFETEVVRAHES